MDRLIAGEESEWARFCHLFGPLIFAAGRRVGLTTDERDDLLQNSSIVCFHSIHRLRDPRRLSSWVYRIAYRLALEIVKKRSPGVSTDDEDGQAFVEQLPSDAESEDVLVERTERAQHLVQALEELGGRCQRLLEVLYLETEVSSYEDVSRQLGMPIGSIGPTRARCLERVRRKLKSVSAVRFFPTDGRTEFVEEPTEHEK